MSIGDEEQVVDLAGWSIRAGGRPGQVVDPGSLPKGA